MSRGPDHECGITLATEQVLARSASRALVVRSLVVYTDGTLLTLSVHSLAPLGDWWDGVVSLDSPGSLRVGYGYLAGGESSALHPLIPPIADGELEADLVSAGGSDGDVGEFTTTVWVSPRRTGRFHITARWIREGIPETRLDYAMPSNELCRERIIDLWRPDSTTEISR